jgi:CRISPR/Cas system-associated exonuclease Cas4 (RecB family)
MWHEGYKKPKFLKETEWRVKHTYMLRSLVKDIEENYPGEVEILIENQVKFTHMLEGDPPITLQGKPDVVCVPGDKNEPFAIYDCKTGKPRGSHLAQVGIYMLYLPPLLEARYGAREVKGYVVYEENGPEPEEVSEGLLEQLKEGIKRLCLELSEYPPHTPPSLRPTKENCEFCPAREVCRSRHSEDV